MKSRFLRKLDKDTKDAVGIIIKRSVVRKYNMYLSRNTHISNTSCLRNKYSFTRNYYTVTLMGTQKVATHETGPNRSDMTGVSGSNRSPNQIVFRPIINLHVYRCENKHTNERKTWIVGPIGDLNTCHYQIQTIFENKSILIVCVFTCRQTWRGVHTPTRSTIILMWSVYCD